jgi:mitochondrial inner membrane protease ATP23
MSATTPAPSNPVSVTKENREKEQAAFKERCDGFVEKGLARNMTVRFLLDNLHKLGCQPPKGFIKCLDCGDTQAGGGFGVVEQIVLVNGKDDSMPSQKKCRRDIFDAQLSTKETLKLLPEIYLCQQHLRDETHAHESMVHELIHAVDVCR